MNIITLLVFCILFSSSTCITFKLMRNKQTCLGFPAPNTYDLEFSVSGENQENIYCRIQDQTGKNLKTVDGQRHFQTTLNVTDSNTKICFSSLDNEDKYVSCQLLAIDDPMRSQIIQKDLNKIYSQLQSLNLLQEKVYRNQHFFYQRNRVHKQKLDHIQYRIKVIKAWKVLLLIICGAFQYFFLKKIVDRKTLPIV